MAIQVQLEVLKQGVKEWNRWRLEYLLIKPDLSNANLVKARLRGVNLSQTNLMGAQLNEADLSTTDLSNADLSTSNLNKALFVRANLRESNLTNANLTNASFRNAILINAALRNAQMKGAYLGGANLTRADLSGADLTNSNLEGANLQNANLSGTNLTNAIIGWTIFVNNNLSTIIGLDTVRHLGPSNLGIDTIYRSKGNISDAFLRRAGIPDNFISYMGALTGKAFEFNSCFISHSSKDKRFCERLYADLQANGVRTWYFPEDARWGESVWGEIDRSIKIYDKLIVVCSKDSLQSGPVQKEVERALNREDREKKNILFPIRIDNYIFDIWAHERRDDVLSKVIGDFTGWNRAIKKYEVAFKKLLTALQTE